MRKIISGSLLSLHYPAALVLVAGEDEEEAISHRLFDIQLGVLDVGPGSSCSRSKSSEG